MAIKRIDTARWIIDTLTRIVDDRLTFATWPSPQPRWWGSVSFQRILLRIRSASNDFQWLTDSFLEFSQVDSDHWDSRSLTPVSVEFIHLAGTPLLPGFPSPGVLAPLHTKGQLRLIWVFQWWAKFSILIFTNLGFPTIVVKFNFRSFWEF